MTPAASPLDAATVNRAAPPGSMRYFALLYVPTEKRDAATALFVIDSELRESGRSTNHDVAHTRLQWWRQEIDRLVNANAQHPATRVVAGLGLEGKVLAKLHELIAATDMDLARMTFANDRELRAYCARSGGAATELLAHVVAPARALNEEALKVANRLGSLIRAAEIVRDIHQDAYAGRIYVPLDLLDRHSVSHSDLRAKDLSAPVRQALAVFGSDLQQAFATTIASIPTSARAYFRPITVLAELHAALLAKMAHADYNVGVDRLELGPIQKPWIAWRAARRSK